MNDPYGEPNDPIEMYNMAMPTRSLAEMMNLVQGGVQIAAPPIMNPSQSKQLYDAIQLLAPAGTAACQLLPAYFKSYGGHVVLMPPAGHNAPDLSMMAWAIMIVPYFSEKVLNSADLQTFVAILEKAQNAYTVSTGSTKFSTTITDSIIGL